jgi:hypothetical protein
MCGILWREFAGKFLAHPLYTYSQRKDTRLKGKED